MSELARLSPTTSEPISTRVAGEVVMETFVVTNPRSGRIHNSSAVDSDDPLLSAAALAPLELLVHSPPGSLALDGEGSLSIVDAPGSCKIRVLIHFHGGGYVIGYPEASIVLNRLEMEAYSDVVAREGREDSILVVIAPRYRLAKDATHPEIVDDGLCSIEFARRIFGDEVDLILSGDSAGGHLSLCLAQRIRDSGYRLHSKEHLFVVPLYAMYASSPSAFGDDESRLESHVLFGEKGYVLTRAGLEAIVSQVREIASSDILSDVSDLPPHYLISAEFCMLRDEALVYRDRMLEEEGNTCEWEVFRGQIHGFVEPGIASDGEETVRELARLIVERILHRFAES